MADRVVSPRWAMLFFEVLPFTNKKTVSSGVSRPKGLDTSKTAASFCMLFFDVLPFTDDAIHRSESLTTENVLLVTDEMMAVLEHNCLQQLQLLALHLEMLGYITCLLNVQRTKVANENKSCFV